jgi:multiple sugar transport system substrate-binding protein
MSRRRAQYREEIVATKGIRSSPISRRRLLKAGGAAALAARVVPSMIIPRRARAEQKTLRILQFKHFVQGFDEWFSGTFVKAWGEKNDTKVIVDYVGLADINPRAKAEIQSRRGHDLVIFLTPTGIYEDHVIDHREIYEESERRYGKAREFAIRSTYNPKTKKYFAFFPAYQPTVVTYRKDLWYGAQAVPDSWPDVLEEGRRIRLLHDKPVGFSLAPEDNSNFTLRTIMYCFGASEQDRDGKPALKSQATLEALKYVKALYNEAMSKDVLTWDAASNNRFMLNGEGSLTLDTVSIARASENMKLPLAGDFQLAKVPAGPARRIGPAFSFFNYLIWAFAENIDGAKQFLADYIGQSRQAFLASRFQNTPAFPDTVPDLATVVANDADAAPADKYDLLADLATWTTNVGDPGYTNAAIGEIFHAGLIPTMFARAATGQLTPDEALDQADREVRAIFQTWQERGKV